MTASHEERETYDPQTLRSPVRTQDRPDEREGVRATGAAAATWTPAQGAGPDDWLNPAHAYATLSNASRRDASALATSALAESRSEAECVTSDAPMITNGLLEEVTKRVMSTDYLDTARVHIGVRGRQVVLSGIAADDRSRKQIEQLVAGCDGVQGIDNQLRVESAAGDR